MAVQQKAQLVQGVGETLLLFTAAAFFLVSASARHNVALSEMPGYNATGRGGNQPVKVANAFILHIEMCYARKNPGRVLGRGDTGANNRKRSELRGYRMFVHPAFFLHVQRCYAKNAYKKTDTRYAVTSFLKSRL